MKHCIPVYPILPTSEASTLSFVQKLAVLEYRLEKLDERVAALETEIPDIPNISITNGEDGRIEKITLDTVDYYPDEVSIEGTGSSLTGVTVNGTTLNVPQAAGALTGTAILTAAGAAGSVRYERIDDILFLTIKTPPAGLSNLGLIGNLPLTDIENDKTFKVGIVAGDAGNIVFVNADLIKDMAGNVHFNLTGISYADGTYIENPTFAITGLVIQHTTAVVNLSDDY